MKFIEEDFLEKYHGVGTFLTEGREYFDLFLDFIQNDELLEHIKFSNDVLGIPPVYTFIVYERDYLKKDVFNKPMSKAVKQGLGACFGYLYRFIYKSYVPEQCWVNDKLTGIKTASKFNKI